MNIMKSILLIPRLDLVIPPKLQVEQVILHITAIAKKFRPIGLWMLVVVIGAALARICRTEKNDL